MSQGYQDARRTPGAGPRTLFTTADHDVVQIHKELQKPLRSLVVASALCVDTALKQDKRGLN